jgi:transposase
MLVVETVVRIRRELASDKANREIARDLRLSRKVLRKAINAPDGAFDYHRTVQPLPRIGPFHERLDTLLSENEARHRRDRLRMTRIHDLLLHEGLEGSYVAVRRYARRWAEGRRRDPGSDVPAFIPLLFKSGEAYQFAWTHEDVEIAGKPIRVTVAHMRLCASRAIYVRAYPADPCYSFGGNRGGSTRPTHDLQRRGRERLLVLQPAVRLTQTRRSATRPNEVVPALSGLS